MIENELLVEFNNIIKKPEAVDESVYDDRHRGLKKDHPDANGSAGEPTSSSSASVLPVTTESSNQESKRVLSPLAPLPKSSVDPPRVSVGKGKGTTVNSTGKRQRYHARGQDERKSKWSQSVQEWRQHGREEMWEEPSSEADWEEIAPRQKQTLNKPGIVLKSTPPWRRDTKR